MVLHFVTGGKTGKNIYAFLTEFQRYRCTHDVLYTKYMYSTIQALTRSKQILVIHFHANNLLVCPLYCDNIKIHVPGFQLHPTFSDQPPINGAKTWLVKMC